MKVLVLHSELGVLRGGGENFTRNLFTAFAERGHEVSAAFVADPRGRYPIPLPENIHAIPLSGRWSRKFGQETLSSIGRGLCALGVAEAAWDRMQEAVCWRTIRWHSRRFLRRVEGEFKGRWGRYDAIYVHGNVELARSVARYRPTVLRLPGPVGAVELAPAMHAVNAVCANGDALNRLRAILGESFIDLPPGVDDQRFSPGPSSIRAALGWTEQHRVAGYVGRLAHFKGVDLLAAAFRQTARANPDARLIVVGSGEMEKSVRSVLADELGRGVVHIEPDVSHDQLAHWYRAMDVLVMPSRYENFSNSILEAMACGISFLASDVGGNRMLAETGAGCTFEAGSVPSLVAGLGCIFADGEEAARRGMKGAEYVRGRYSWRATSDRLEHIISTQIGRNG